MKELVGYVDPLSVCEGEAASFFVSSSEVDYTVRLVRLIHTDTNPSGPGLKVEAVESPIAGRYEGSVQKIYTGSYAKVVLPHQ